MPVQTPQEALARGNDYSDDETTRAKNYVQNEDDKNRNRMALLALLAGNKTALEELQKKTTALVDDAPAYTVAP